MWPRMRAMPWSSDPWLLRQGVTSGSAGLHQLLMPFRGGLGKLPAPQREALGSVFGLAAGAVPDRFLVGLATLTLITRADGFLARRVPKIMASPAYRGRRHRDQLRRGQRPGRLLRRVVQPQPRAPEPADARKERPGGHAAAVLPSPLIRPGTASTINYNHYSL